MKRSAVLKKKKNSQIYTFAISLLGINGRTLNTYMILYVRPRARPIPCRGEIVTGSAIHNLADDLFRVTSLYEHERIAARIRARGDRQQQRDRGIARTISSLHRESLVITCSGAGCKSTSNCVGGPR